MKLPGDCSCLFLVPLLPLAQTAGPDPQLQKIVQEVRAQVRAGEAFDFVAQLHSIDREDFSRFQQSAEYLQNGPEKDQARTGGTRDQWQGFPPG